MLVPEPTSTQLKFLKPSQVGKVGAKAKLKLTGNVVEAGKKIEFSDIIAEVEFKGEKYGIGIGYDKPNFTRLVEKFGKNTDKWRGSISVEVMKHMGKLYLAIQ